MKSEDLGFEFRERDKPKIGHDKVHHAPLTELEQAAVDSIRVHNQRSVNPAMPADYLAEWLGISGRDLRHLTTHLADRRFHGLPLFACPGSQGGYFLGTEQPQLKALAQRAASTHMRRALTGLRKARDWGASASELAQGMVQLTLGLSRDQAEQVGADMIDGLAQKGIPVSHQAVEAALAKYAADPEQYQREIHDLAKQFGGLFVSRDQLEKVIRARISEGVTAALADLTGKAAA